MEMLLAVLLVRTIPGLLTYLVPERPSARPCATSTRRADFSFTATEFEPAARALPGPVPPLHRGTAAQAALDDRCRDGFLGHLQSVEAVTARGNASGTRIGRSRGAPG